MISKKRTYMKFKYHSEVYHIGDSLMVRDEKGSYVMCKLIQIIPSNGIRKYPYWPSIKIQWYYSKSDIVRDKAGLEDDNLFGSISAYEVFEASHQDIIYIETVVCKCQVVSFEEYLKLEQPSDTIFFKRAKYDPINFVFSPPMENWKKACKCNRPYNPDVLYVKCDKCDMLFHPSCFGISNEEATENNNFYCDECSNEKEN